MNPDLVKWLPAITGLIALAVNLLVTYWNIRNSRQLEKEKKKWDVHVKTLNELEELKHRIVTVETPESYLTHDIEWAMKEGKSREEVFQLVVKYVSAQAEAYHFVKAEYEAKSHLFDPDLREPILSAIQDAENAEELTGPRNNHDFKPLDDKGIELIDLYVASRYQLIAAVNKQLNMAIDRHRAIFR
ncbi:MAG: hypothetical protein H6973_08115 [Gammaproteobacteria bacterium]|nr:hypothetical protein [Gammaproteobacteria bacterium]HRX71330.1 hypothetical protein [Candidatus Competibacteraceae bacterium]